MTDAPTPPHVLALGDPGSGVAERIPRKRVISWALWDWATQPFNSVIITFVFVALYLASDSFIDPAIAALGEGNATYDAAIAALVSKVGWAVTIAGVFVALIAPVIGQRADSSGRRKVWLGGCTLVLIGCMFGLFFVQAQPSFFLLGASLIAIGAVFNEIAGVNYNAMLVQVSNKKSVGRVSGLGWGLGYIGGIVALVIVVVADGADWWGMDTSNGMAYRLIAVGCAVWTVLFAWPIFAYVPEVTGTQHARVSIWRGYAVLIHDLKELWRDARSTLWFLFASAVYRDGLAGVFTFGAIIASKSFGFSNQEVIMFGIAANLIAGVSTIIAGRFDDWLGPRAVILFALGGIVFSGLAVVILHAEGNIVFWVFGLLLTAFVGPAQAASRSLLARVSPPGRESEIFGLYATTGRAASFLAPAMSSIVITLTGATIWGVFGIISVVLAGMIMLLFVKMPPAVRSEGQVGQSSV
ncbi:MFS transporter [Demequina oxidasica]|uniref:MFS transporter n=1 Tax=Demequina oxidasica TaxID=676199 RepID=UPI000780AAAB|nr:MFS transporter [Demequina oxidasica]